MLIALLAAVLIGSAVVLWMRWQTRGVPNATEIPRWSADTVAAFSEGGWSETFDRPVDRTMTIQEYTARWVPVFGRLDVRPGFNAAFGSEGMEDGRDDYAFRLGDAPMGNSELTVEGWWGGAWRSLGAQAVVQAAPPHPFYEAALWEGAFHLFRFRGPTSGDFDTLAEVEVGELDPGFYRIVFRTEHDGAAWSLDARLVNISQGREIARVSAVSAALPSSGHHGIGLLSGERSFIYGVAVRALESATSPAGGPQ